MWFQLSHSFHPPSHPVISVPSLICRMRTHKHVTTQTYCHLGHRIQDGTLVSLGYFNKAPQTEGVNSRNLFSHCSRSQESKIKLFGASLLGLQMATFPLQDHSNLVFPLGMFLPQILHLLKTQVHMALFYLNHFFKGHIVRFWGLRL
jgi:hypothetical protein